MTYAAGAYIFSLISDAFLIFLSVYHVIAFDELKTDFKNPIDHCNNLNPLVLPEYCLHLFMTLLFLLSGEWITFVINLPLAVYNINRFYKATARSAARKPLQKLLVNIYDPTTIMNSDQLSRATKEGWFKLFFFLFSFFFYIYGLISSLMAADV